MELRGWDRWAGMYRWLEFLLLGGMLSRSRRQMAELLPDRDGALEDPRNPLEYNGLEPQTSTGSERWLLLGCGDGRGLVQILNAGPHPTLDVVDISPAMLRAARRRVEATGQGGRVDWFMGDLRLGLESAAPLPPAPDHGVGGDREDLVGVNLGLSSPAPSPRLDPQARYAGVITSFFLDCFTDAELEGWWSGVADRVKPGGRWLVGDFEPPQRLKAWAAQRQRALLGILYPAFRWSTTLRAHRLPDLEAPFRRGGWNRELHRRSKSGITGTTIWRKPPRTPGPGSPLASPGVRK